MLNFEEIKKIKWMFNMMMEGFHHTKTGTKINFASCLMEVNEDKELQEKFLKNFTNQDFTNLTLLVAVFENEWLSMELFINEKDFRGTLVYKSPLETKKFQTKDLSMLRRSLAHVYGTFLNPMANDVDLEYRYDAYKSLYSFLLDEA